MSNPKKIEKPKLLLVDGIDPEGVFKALINDLNLLDIQIQNYGGNAELPSFLKALKNLTGFETDVISLGIVRDAELNAKSAFQSISSALKNVGFKAPKRVEVPQGKNPMISVLIIPNSAGAGMLESLCMQSVNNNKVITCIDKFFECINKEKGSIPSNIDKARAHAFLSSCERPNLSVGAAAQAGYWNLNDPIFDHVKAFLNSL